MEPKRKLGAPNPRGWLRSSGTLRVRTHGRSKAVICSRGLGAISKVEVGRWDETLTEGSRRRRETDWSICAVRH